MKNPNPVENGDGAMLYFVAKEPFLFYKITNMTLIAKSILSDKNIEVTDHYIMFRCPLLYSVENKNV